MNAWKWLKSALRFLGLDNEIGLLGNWPKGIVEDRYDFFFEGYDEVKSIIETIFEIKNPTEGAYDQRTSAIGAGKLVQKASENTSVTFRRPTEAFTAYCVYRDFDDGMELTKNEVNDFPTSKVRDLAQEWIKGWGQALRLTEDDFAVTLFTKGGFTAGHANFGNVIPGLLSQNTDNLAYDAKPFFNRSDNLRTSKGGGTYFNTITGTLDISNYETLYNRVFVTNAKNERDERINLKMGKVALVFPPQQRSAAVRTIESEYLPGDNKNDRNPHFKSAELVEWDALNVNESAWYLGVLKQGIRFYRRGKPEIRMFRNEDNFSYRSTINARYGFMGWNFRFWGSGNAPTS